MGQGSLTRREFIRVGTGAMAATTAAKVTIIEPNPGFARSRAVAPSDTVRFASIGTGVRIKQRLARSDTQNHRGLQRAPKRATLL